MKELIMKFLTFEWTLWGILQSTFIGLVLMIAIISGLYSIFINVDDWLKKRRNKKLQNKIGLSHLLKK